jgi:hypothetical protein
MAVRFCTTLLICLAAVEPLEAAEPERAAVRTARVPEGGVQPRAAVDDRGVLHLIYLTGDAMNADVQYVRSHDGGETFGQPARVNAHPGSAIAVGTIRGAHLALGKGGRVHVAWMGSGHAQPKAPGRQAPMLYTRLRDDGTFEPERNVLTKYVGLDGGGSVAADPDGNVYVAWHAPDVKGGDEGTRRVFVARSGDDGATFAPEGPITEAGLGACGCCGMTVLAAPGGTTVGLFRSATDQTHRDTRAFLLQGGENRNPGAMLDPMESGVCVMSTYALANLPGQKSFLAAWETGGRIRFGTYAYRSPASGRVHDLPDAVRGGAGNQKHPAIAVDRQGNALIAWAEDTGWEKGGSVAWQVFDRELRPVPGAAGRADGLPVWSLPAAAAVPGHGFIVMY